MTQLKEPIIANVSGYSKEGDGTARVQGNHRLKIIGGAKGDQLQVRIIRKERHHLLAKIQSILSPSQKRIQPKCPHAGVCGGCRLQHISYREQLNIKQTNIEKLFDGYLVNPIIECETPWYYRGKMEYSFSQDAKGQCFLGLIESGSSGRVLNMQECHIAPQNFMPLIHSVKKWFEKHALSAYNFKTGQGLVRSLALRSSQRSGHVQATLTISDPLSHDVEQDFIQHIKTMTTSIYLNIHTAKRGEVSKQQLVHIHGKTHFEEELQIQYKGQMRPLKLCATPYSFMQPNPLQSQVILQEALTMAALKGNERILDLYSGVGTIGLSFAPYVHEVYAVEIVKDAIENAQKNSELNQLHNITSVACDVREALLDEKLYRKMRHADIAIIDPPRGGIEPKAIEELLKLAPKKILYISCNPKTQAHDMKYFEEEYSVGKIQPIDQFPHTMHVENLMILFRKKS